MEMEIDGSNELKELQEMKRLLEKKERSLSKYNRVKKVKKDNVQKAVLKKNFENSCTDTNSPAYRKLIKEATDYLPSVILKEDSLNGPDDDTSCFSDKVDKIRGKDEFLAHFCSKVKDNSFYKNSDSTDVPCNMLKKSLSVELCLSDSTNIHTLVSSPTTPVIVRKRLVKENFNKKHVKRLFTNNNNDNNNNNNNNNNDILIEQFSGNIYSSQSHMPCVNDEENLSFLSDKKATETYESYSKDLESFKDSSRKENCVSKCKPVSDDHYLLNDSSKKVLSSCLASIPDKNPHIFVLYSNGFSIWSLYNLETEHASRRCWKENLSKDFTFRNMNSPFCLLGSGSSHCIYFILIRAPSEINSQFEVDLVSMSPLGELVVNEDNSFGKLFFVEDYLPLSGCEECSFSCCDLQNWKFLFSFHGCRNTNCFNFKISQVFYIFSFDLIYSEKRNKWEFKLEIGKEYFFEHVLLSTVLLHKHESFDSSEDMVMWCDTSGNFGFTDTNFNYTCPKSVSNLELKKEFSSCKVLYAASVKEILIVVLKSKEKLKFLAMNPLNCDFEVFREIPLRKMKLDGNSQLSVIFYEERFHFVTTRGVTFSLDLY